jgi:hypothetical protein
MSCRGSVPITQAVMIAACANTLSEALENTGAFLE